VETKAVRVLGTVVGSVVFGLAVVNAQRGEWEMAIRGAFILVMVAIVLAAQQMPNRR
jgi:hypothetical protein